MPKAPTTPSTDLVRRQGGSPVSQTAAGTPHYATVPRLLLATRPNEVTLVCDVDQPLWPDDPRWQDLTAGRGDRAVQHMRRRLSDKPPGKFLPLVFMSHRGAGKTTELLRLQSELAHRYESLYLQANVEMDPYTIEAEDLLLVLARAVEGFMRERGTPLPGDLLERVTRWFNEVSQSTQWGKDYSAEIAGGVKAEGGIPFFAKLTSSLTAVFKVESKHREEIKLVLKKYPGTLLDSVNQLLDGAREVLHAEGKELLVVIDNLDRYSPKVIDDLIVRGGDRIRSLHCNLLLTPPISLFYRPESEQIDTYFQCEVMNTVRLRRPEQPYDAFDGPGRDLLLEALARRVDLDALIPDAAARDRLVVASGGAIRELLDLVVDASLLADGDVITREDVERAVKRRRQRMRDLINANGYWPTLARVAQDKQIFEEDACMDVLFHRLVFKYNGDGWYDVHPLVAEMPEFHRAYKPSVVSVG